MVRVRQVAKFGTLLGLVIALVYGASPAFANTQITQSQIGKEPEGITLSPPSQNLSLAVGMTDANVALKLVNRSGKDITANLSLVNFQALDAFGGVSLDQVGATGGKYSLAKWMELPEGNTISVANNSIATIPIVIKNTKDLAPGGHYGAVIISVNTGQTANSINLRQNLVSLMFVDKMGGEVYGLQLNSFTPNTLHSVPQDVTMSFKSTGNVHVVPRGYVTVNDPHGQLVAKGIINPESTLVMPGTSRQFVTILQPVNSSTRKGRYTLTVHYRYDGNANFTTKTMSFRIGYVSKALVIAATLGFIILISGILYFIRRRTLKRPLSSRR